MRVAVEPSNLEVYLPAAEVAGAASGSADVEAEAAGAYTAVYEYEEGDCIFIDNLAVAHRATPEAHEPASKVRPPSRPPRPPRLSSCPTTFAPTSQ